MTYTHRCLITPADLAPLARALTEAVAGPAGAGMFQTPLSATGTEATHYISSGMIEDRFADILTSPEALYAAITEATPEGDPVPVSLEQCEDLLTRSDISDEEPFEALARLELQLVSGDE